MISLALCVPLPASTSTIPQRPPLTGDKQLNDRVNYRFYFFFFRLNFRLDKGGRKTQFSYSKRKIKKQTNAYRFPKVMKECSSFFLTFIQGFVKENMQQSKTCVPQKLKS